MRNMSLASIMLPVILGFIASSSSLSTQDASLTLSSLKTVTGYAKVSDGDSLRIGQVRVRLFGIDALEGRQSCTFNRQEWACGRAAKKALERLTKGQKVSCSVIDKDKYDRSVSICRVGNRDINESLVRNGWAVAYTQYSSRYAGAERDARLNERGIWRSEFERPHDYRKRIRKVQEIKASQNTDGRPHPSCVIKGNISRNGNRIYHMPGQRDYARTSINVKNDERWFCTEEEALDSGWRKAQR
jgi:endonuclease YncB( thermonuclease family)